MPTEIPTLTPHQTRQTVQSGSLLIDLRPYARFAPGHIPGSLNIVFSHKSLPERIAIAIPPALPVVLLAEEAAVAEAAGNAVDGAHRNPVEGIITAGIEPWRDAGFPIATLPQVPVTMLRQRLNDPNDKLILIDVREPFEWEWGYIDGALLIPLGEIWQRTATLDQHRDVVLICGEGIRSSTAASILLHHNFPRVSNVPGGMGDWLTADYPTVRLSTPQSSQQTGPPKAPKS